VSACGIYGVLFLGDSKMKKRLLVIGIGMGFLLGVLFVLNLAFTRSWNESLPTDSTYANEIDDYMRYLRVDVAERVENMIAGFNSGDSNEGFYYALFLQQSATPTVSTDEIGIYALSDGTNCGLFAKNEDGYTKQVLRKIGTDIQLFVEAADVNDNTFNDTETRLRNNYNLRARNAAGTADVNVIKVNTSDEVVLGAVTTLPDTSKLATSGAPAADAQIANKKYVDDALGQSVTKTGSDDITNTSANWADVTWDGDDSVTITTKGGNILLLCSMTLFHASPSAVCIRFDIDGTPHGEQRMRDGGGNEDRGTTIHWLETSLVAGSHTFKVQWKDQEGTAQQYGTAAKRVFTVIELPS
jgi:hypothetical protein